ncbi:MAG: hypothetical protein ACT4OE_04940, partial [Sphingosinicella sp.]
RGLCMPIKRTEDSEKEFAAMLLARAGIDYEDLVAGKLTLADFRRLAEAAAGLQSLSTSIEPQGG